MSNKKHERRIFTDEFKSQIVQLYLKGKSKADIRKEYDLYPSTLDKWIKQDQVAGSFRAKDNLTDQQKELIALCKRNKQLEMENDILKQAALMMGRK